MVVTPVNICFFSSIPDLQQKQQGDISLLEEKEWTNFYFVLDDEFLIYFNSLHDKRNYNPSGLIPLDDVHSVAEVECGKPNTFQILTSKKMVS